jgi:hypothetical protein
VTTGVQDISKPLKNLDSGFRRNSVEKNLVDFFTPSGRVGAGGIRMEAPEFFIFPLSPGPFPANGEGFSDKHEMEIIAFLI